MPHLTKAINTDRTPTLSPARFCWRESFFLAHESLWSILHKFAYLNYCGASEIQNFFAIRNAPHIRNSTDKLNNFKLKELADCLHLTGTCLGSSTTELYLFGGAEEMLSADHLRFCADCIEFGYHSPIHQLLFVDKCPHHYTKILDSCIYCGRQKSIIISPSEFNNPYSCSYCLKPFFTHIKQFLFFRYSNEYRSEVENCFGEFSSNLALRKATRGSFSEHIVFVKSKAGERFTSKYICNTNNLMSRALRGSNNSACIYMEQVADEKYDEKPGLGAIYRSVREMIFKKALGKHRKCVKCLLQTKASSKKSELSCIKNICRYALAFIFWRMYFEEANAPNELLMKRQNNNDRINFEEFLPVGLNCRLAERYFAILCLYVFKQCLPEASAMIDGGSLDFIQHKIQLAPGPPISNMPKGVVKQRSIRIYTHAQGGEFDAFNRKHYRNCREACTEVNGVGIDWLHQNYSGFHPRSR